MKRLSGVVTPTVTPFLDNEDIDVGALRTLTSRLIGQGVGGLFPCGTTGEGHLLSMEERKLVAETVVREAAGRVPVYIQSGAMSLKDSIELSQHAVDCGADGVGVVTPSYYALSRSAIEDYYAAIAGALPKDFPIYLYSIPENALNDITPAAAASLADRCENIIGIKYSGDDFVQLEAYTEIRGGTFSVFSGNDRTFAAVMAAGCDGTVSGLSNIFTELIVSVYAAFKDGDTDLAMQLQKKVYRNSLCLFDAYFLASLKAGIGLTGIEVGKPRKPLPELTREESRHLKKAFSGMKLTQPENPR